MVNTTWPEAPRQATVFGGSGFLGRQVTQALAHRGWRVRVAVRRPDEALFTRTYGVPGQIVPVLCNVRDDASVAAALVGSDAAVNCVGLARQSGRNTFAAVDDEGAVRVARLSTGVARLVHVSMLGADADSPSRLLAAKGRGDAGVMAARPDAVILRPAMMFGEGDDSYTKFAAKTKVFPFVVPIAGGHSPVQPVFVEDVAEAAARAVENPIFCGIYDLAGPDRMTINDMVRQALASAHRRRGIFAMPGWLARFLGGAMDLGSTLTGGLIQNRVMTRDYVRMVSRDMGLPEGAAGLAAFGITPTAPQAVIDDYLWRFRPSGQYAAIKDSAQALRTR